MSLVSPLFSEEILLRFLSNDSYLWDSSAVFLLRDKDFPAYLPDP